MLALLLSILWNIFLVCAITVCSLLAFLGYHQLKNHRHYRQTGCNIPYVPEKPFIGSTRPGPQYQNRLRDTQKLGPVVYSTLLHTTHITVADPDIVHYITSVGRFPKSPFIENLKVFWGEDIFNMQHGEGGRWKKERKLVDPAFRLSNLKSMRQTLALHAVNFTEIMLQHAANQAHGGDSFDFTLGIFKWTMDVISTAGFSYPMQASDASRDANPFIVAINTFAAGVQTPLVLLPFGMQMIANKYRKQREIVDATFYKVIDERLAELERGERDGTQIRDLLDAMLKPDENGNRLSREELRNELFVFYLAGYETSAIAITWIMYMICQHPDVEKKLIEELDCVMGPADGKVMAPTNEQLDQLEYMRMVIDETLRLYPPAHGVSRVIPETFEMKGYVFPKGCNIGCSIYALHRDPNLWEDPESFNPDRFSKENSVGRHPSAFMPFSSGLRICIGRNLFYNETKMLLATMLRAVKFELDLNKENGKFELFDHLIKPEHLWLRATPRVASN